MKLAFSQRRKMMLKLLKQEWPKEKLEAAFVELNISPQERPLWPEALYLITEKSRQGYTLEAPSDFPLQARVNALVAGVNAALA